MYYARSYMSLTHRMVAHCNSMDQAFLPRHYEATPRQTYYHTMMALSPVVHRGAPIFLTKSAFGTARLALDVEAILTPPCIFHW